MLVLGRRVMPDVNPASAITMTLPDGRPVRFWITPNARPGLVSVCIDAPDDVRIARDDRKPYPPVVPITGGDAA